MSTQLHAEVNPCQQSLQACGQQDFWAQLDNLQRHPAYLIGCQTDPVRGLLAAVVLRVILDINPNRKIKDYYRETARQFLTDREGQEWLKCFGIPSSKIMPFVKNLD